MQLDTLRMVFGLNIKGFLPVQDKYEFVILPVDAAPKGTHFLSEFINSTFRNSYFLKAVPLN
jgi:hypothetical protein